MFNKQHFSCFPVANDIIQAVKGRKNNYAVVLMPFTDKETCFIAL